MKAKKAKVIPYIVTSIDTDQYVCELTIERYNIRKYKDETKIEISYISFLNRLLKLAFDDYTAREIIINSNDSIFINLGAYSDTDIIDTSMIDFGVDSVYPRFEIAIKRCKELRQAFTDAVNSDRKYRNIQII